MSKLTRSLNLDIYRALAVLFMVIFHFTYDLNYFGFIELKTTQSPFWIHFRTLIVTMFMSAVGMSFYIVYHESFHLKKYIKRLQLLGLTSLIISIVTYFIFPKSWIYFGVIHMIFLSSIIGPFFAKKPNISGVLGVGIIVLYLLGYRLTPLFELLQAPLYLPKYHTEDLAPMIPWFGVILLGIFAMHYKLIEVIKIKESLFTKRVAFIGKHTLFIYLIHQVILFAILGAIAYLSKL